MTALTVKQRAKVNAALCLIHDYGGDASAVSGLAVEMIAAGHNPRLSFEKALNTFARTNPELGEAIGKVTRLVEASSPATVAQYDQALSQYIDTGDNSGLTALAPTIAKDSIALAIHNGEMTEADAGEGGLEMALGFLPGPLLAAAAAQSEASPAEPAERPQPARFEVHYTGFAPDDGPVLNGSNPNGVREAAKSAASRVGQAVELSAA